MIVVRAPLRISIAGGGTDLPSYYEHHGGTSFISAAINKYVYVSVHETFDNSFILNYSKREEVFEVDAIEHPIIRETLKHLNITRGLEISCVADVPSGTGLGSSSSFTVALLTALRVYQGTLQGSKYQIAQEAVKIELERVNSPIGIQDQYISALGGIRKFVVSKRGKVSDTELMETPIYSKFKLFYTGLTRSANYILQQQDDLTSIKNPEMLRNLDQVSSLGAEIEQALLLENPKSLGYLFKEQWNAKKQRSQFASNLDIDSLFVLGLHAGAMGGKLIGAGGGGFLLFVVDSPQTSERLTKSMTAAHCPELKYFYDLEGVKIVYHG